MPRPGCAGGCGGSVNGGKHFACRRCLDRLPQPLRRLYRHALRTWDERGLPTGVSRYEVQRRLESWWRDNPAPPRDENEPPAWRRHQQI